MDRKNSIKRQVEKEKKIAPTHVFCIWSLARFLENFLLAKWRLHFLQPVLSVTSYILFGRTAPESRHAYVKALYRCISSKTLPLTLASAGCCYLQGDMAGLQKMVYISLHRTYSKSFSLDSEAILEYWPWVTSSYRNFSHVLTLHEKSTMRKVYTV